MNVGVTYKVNEDKEKPTMFLVTLLVETHISLKTQTLIKDTDLSILPSTPSFFSLGSYSPTLVKTRRCRCRRPDTKTRAHKERVVGGSGLMVRGKDVSRVKEKPVMMKLMDPLE